mmetsp:Transcript_17615/g.57134  ORF Transcript_17615/g.57134 Transcript_17615/m.57134 type:complete len:417 (+) Transcript_17615:5191-6441(+)
MLQLPGVLVLDVAGCENPTDATTSLSTGSGLAEPLTPAGHRARHTVSKISPPKVTQARCGHRLRGVLVPPEPVQARVFFRVRSRTRREGPADAVLRSEVTLSPSANRTARTVLRRLRQLGALREQLQFRGVHLRTIQDDQVNPFELGATLFGEMVTEEAVERVPELLERHAGRFLCSTRPTKSASFDVNSFYVSAVVPKITEEAWVAARKKKTVKKLFNKVGSSFSENPYGCGNWFYVGHPPPDLTYLKDRAMTPDNVDLDVGVRRRGYVATRVAGPATRPRRPELGVPTSPPRGGPVTTSPPHGRPIFVNATSSPLTQPSFSDKASSPLGPPETPVNEQNRRRKTFGKPHAIDPTKLEGELSDYEMAVLYALVKRAAVTIDGVETIEIPADATRGRPRPLKLVVVAQGDDAAPEC